MKKKNHPILGQGGKGDPVKRLLCISRLVTAIQRAFTYMHMATDVVDASGLLRTRWPLQDRMTERLVRNWEVDRFAKGLALDYRFDR